MIFTIVVFALTLGVLVFVHELGHFLFAKIQGIKVDEFGIGFPPRLFSRKYGETKYSLNLIPLGGYVSLYGESGEHEEDERSFSSRSVWQRVKVVFAGVLMNFLFGFLIFIIYFSLGNPPTVTDPAKYLPTEKVTYQTIVIEVQEGSSAKEIGLEQGDVIAKVGEQKIGKVEDLIVYTQDHPGQTKMISYKDSSQQNQLTEKEIIISNKGKIGAMISQGYGRMDYVFYQVPLIALEESVRIVGLIFVTLYQIIAKLLVEQTVQEGVVGPVGIFVLTSEMVKLGIGPLLKLVGFLSMNLAVVNLIPIPALDGGQLVILAYEKIKGRKAREEVVGFLQVSGFILLIVIIILITYRDIVKFIL